MFANSFNCIHRALLSNNLAYADLVKEVEQTIIDAIITGDASFKTVYNLLAKAGIELDMESGIVLYGNAVTKLSNKISGIESITDDLAHLSEHADRTIKKSLENQGKAKKPGNLTGQRLNSANTIALNLLGVFRNKALPKAARDSLSLQMQKAVLNFARDKVKEDVASTKDITKLLTDAIDLQLASKDQKGAAQIDQLFKDVQKSVRAISSQLDAYTRAEIENDLDKLRSVTLDMAMTANDKRLILRDALMQNKAYVKEVNSIGGKVEVLDWNAVADGNAYENIRKGIAKFLEKKGYDEDQITWAADALYNEYNLLQQEKVDNVSQVYNKKDLKEPKTLKNITDQLAIYMGFYKTDNARKVADYSPDAVRFGTATARLAGKVNDHNLKVAEGLASGNAAYTAADTIDTTLPVDKQLEKLAIQFIERANVKELRGAVRAVNKITVDNNRKRTIRPSLIRRLSTLSDLNAGEPVFQDLIANTFEIEIGAEAVALVQEVLGKIKDSAEAAVNPPQDAIDALERTGMKNGAEIITMMEPHNQMITSMNVLVKELEVGLINTSGTGLERAIAISRMVFNIIRSAVLVSKGNLTENGISLLGNTIGSLELDSKLRAYARSVGRSQIRMGANQVYDSSINDVSMHSTETDYFVEKFWGDSTAKAFLARMTSIELGMLATIDMMGVVMVAQSQFLLSVQDQLKARGIKNPSQQILNFLKEPNIITAAESIVDNQYKIIYGSNYADYVKSNGYKKTRAREIAAVQNSLIARWPFTTDSGQTIIIGDNRVRTFQDAGRAMANHIIGKKAIAGTTEESAQKTVKAAQEWFGVGLADKWYDENVKAYRQNKSYGTAFKMIANRLMWGFGKNMWGFPGALIFAGRSYDAIVGIVEFPERLARKFNLIKGKSTAEANVDRVLQGGENTSADNEQEVYKFLEQRSLIRFRHNYSATAWAMTAAAVIALMAFGADDDEDDTYWDDLLKGITKLEGLMGNWKRMFLAVSPPPIRMAIAANKTINKGAKGGLFKAKKTEIIKSMIDAIFGARELGGGIYGFFEKMFDFKGELKRKTVLATIGGILSNSIFPPPTQLLTPISDLIYGAGETRQLPYSPYEGVLTDFRFRQALEMALDKFNGTKPFLSEEAKKVWLFNKGSRDPIEFRKDFERSSAELAVIVGKASDPSASERDKQKGYEVLEMFKKYSLIDDNDLFQNVAAEIDNKTASLLLINNALRLDIAAIDKGIQDVADKVFEIKATDEETVNNVKAFLAQTLGPVDTGTAVSYIERLKTALAAHMHETNILGTYDPSGFKLGVDKELAFTWDAIIEQLYPDLGMPKRTDYTGVSTTYIDPFAVAIKDYAQTNDFKTSGSQKNIVESLDTQVANAKAYEIGKGYGNTNKFVNPTMPVTPSFKIKN